MKLAVLLVLSLLFDLSFESQEFLGRRYKTKQNNRHIYIRMITMMKTVLNEGLLRTKTLNHLRFMYEESPFYEMGYLMGEIVERYRKMVNHARRRFQWQSAYIHDLIRRVQVLQFLYFEVYNLCRMLNQIELKYKTNFEFQDIHSDIPIDVLVKHHEMERQEAIFMAKERQRELKKARKIRRKKTSLTGVLTRFDHPNKKPNRFFPLDYGWDIGQYW